MEILGKYGKEDLAYLYIAKIDDKIVEFVESIQPPIERKDKWVLIISTLFGCPIKCLMCDAGEYYNGKVSKGGMLKQIDFMIQKRYPDRKIPIPKIKIQFARMGEPSLNPDVLDVLRELPKIYDAPGLIPCISTVGPNNTNKFFQELLLIKDKLYPKGYFQIQFSIHSTDKTERQKWITKNIWSFEKIKNFGDEWFKPGDRKITLNFAVGKDSIIDPKIIQKYFKPSKYFIKLTPINPTSKAIDNNLESGITEQNAKNLGLAEEFRNLGYNTLISIGAWEENQIGSNCGQFATEFKNGKVKIKNHYSCEEYIC